MLSLSPCPLLLSASLMLDRDWRDHEKHRILDGGGVDLDSVV